MDYYGDHDRGACAWLRELIREGHLPEGEVDERPIQELSAADVAGFRQCHFFAGIGGWPLALRLAGLPADRPVWTGSCPCQPFSSAGKRRREQDARHLWPDFLRLIRDARPATCFGEQVSGHDGYEWLAGVRADLEAEGYAVGAADLPAGCAGAPQIRQRLFWVASAQGSGRDGWAEPAGVSGQEAGQGKRLLRPEGHGATCAVAGASSGRGDGAARSVEAGQGRPGDARPDAAGQHPEDEQDAGIAESVACGAGHGLQGQLAGGPEAGPVKRSGVVGFWDRFDVIHCTDGKARRVEPGVHPLAHGVPGRVGLLRGYGNAIVPQVAAAFVRAYLDVEAALT